MFRSILALMILALTVGCGVPPRFEGTPTLTIHPDTPAAAIEAAIDAAEQWSASGLEIRVQIAPSGPQGTLWVGDWCPEATADYLAPGGKVACTTSYPGVKRKADIVIATRLVDSRQLRAVVAHEVGHWLGLGHSDTDLMGPAAKVGSEVSEDDIAALRELYGMKGE